MAIRFGELPDSRLSARRIASNRRFLCASPKYLEKYGTPERVDDLAEHRCIIHRQNDDAYGVWRYIVNDHIEAIKVKGALSSNDGDIVLRWALDGHGILIRLRMGSGQVRAERTAQSRAAQHGASIGRSVCLLPLGRRTRRFARAPSSTFGQPVSGRRSRRNRNRRSTA